MNVLKILPIAFLALFIDAFTFFVSLALAVMTAFPGTIGGCAVGGAVAGKAGCAILGLLGSIPWVNGALAVVTEPIGVLLGITFTICINFTLGSMLILFLKFAGIFDGKVVVGALIGEAIPGVNMLPLWTGMVWGCAKKSIKEEVLDKTLGGVATLSTSFSLSNISKINPTMGGAVQQGQRMGAGVAFTGLVPQEQEQVDDSTRTAYSEAKINLKTNVGRLKSNINGDIAPKVSPSYGQEIPA